MARIEHSRTKILNAAEKVFSRKGYYKASMDDIAMEAQVAKGTLYYHFPGKLPLFEALLREGFAYIFQEIGKKIESVEAVHDIARIAIDLQVDLFYENQMLVQIFFNEISAGLDEKFRNTVKKMRDEYIQFYASLLREGREDGLVRVDNPELAAFGILSLVQSMCSYAAGNTISISKEAVKTEISRLLFGTLFISKEGTA